MSVSTPSVLVLTPEGELVTEISNYANAEQMLKGLQKALGEHPVYAKATESESALEGVSKARYLEDLGRSEEALVALKGLEGNEASLERAEIALRLERLDLADAMLGSMTDSKTDTARHHLLRGRLALARGQSADAITSLSQVSTGDQATAARYHLGLAHYQAGEVEKARAAWKALVVEADEDAWVYRADWAYCESKPGKKSRRMFSSNDSSDSLLGRIGYMGGRHPDLKKIKSKSRP